MRETKSQEPGKEFRHFTAKPNEYQMLMNLQNRAQFQGKNTQLVKIDNGYVLTEETIII